LGDLFPVPLKKVHLHGIICSSNHLVTIKNRPFFKILFRYLHFTRKGDFFVPFLEKLQNKVAAKKLILMTFWTASICNRTKFGIK
jgi:hypothetical protein